MLEGRYDDRGPTSPTPARIGASSFDSYVRAGGRLLAIRNAHPSASTTGRAGGDIVGARWRWGTSSHPPLGPMKVQVVASHVLTEEGRLRDLFDEAYGHLDLAADLEPLAVSRWDDIDHPVLWEREVGAGTVVTCTLGHGRESLENPAHRRILVNAMELLGRDPEPVRPHRRTTQTPLEEQR
ncbi:MAG: ThuA domain-containing protein [Microthrixaceae bacterium]